MQQEFMTEGPVKSTAAGILKLVVFAAGFVAVSEITCRIYSAYGVSGNPKPVSRDIEWKTYAKDLELARKNKSKFYDYYVYSPSEFTSPSINFTGYYGARLTPDSAVRSGAGRRIWMFGSSTLQELGTVDKLTIANQLAANLNSKGERTTRVENFGTGGYHLSLELIKFVDILRRVSPDERPHTVIFYDGYTDAIFSLYHGAGSMGEDMRSKLEALVEGKYGKLLPYLASQALSEYSNVWSRFVAPRINNAEFQTTRKDSSEEALAKSVDLYVRNVKLIQAVCREYGIRPFFILQPLLIFKKGMVPEEEQYCRDKVAGIEKEWTREFYRRVMERCKGDASVVDLTAVFDGDRDKDFVDFGHTMPLSGIKVGKALADVISTQ